MANDILEALKLEKPLMAVCQLPGVKDLPLAVRGHFGQALIKEAQGNHWGAAESLDKAVEKELALV